jgi:hypothetical protein
MHDERDENGEKKLPGLVSLFYKHSGGLNVKELISQKKTERE